MSDASGLRSVLKASGYDWTKLRTSLATQCLISWVNSGLTQNELRDMIATAKAQGEMPDSIAGLNLFRGQEPQMQSKNRRGSKEIWDRMREKGVSPDSAFGQLVSETQRLWFSLSLRFGPKWDKPAGAIGGDGFKNWVRLLERNKVTAGQLAAYHAGLENQSLQWPPKIDDVLVEIVKANESASKAFQIALEGRRNGIWTDGKIFAAYQRAGGAWAFSHEPESVLRPKFNRCYGDVCREATQGEDFPVPMIEKRLERSTAPRRNKEIGLEALDLLRQQLGMPARRQSTVDG